MSYKKNQPTKWRAYQEELELQETVEQVYLNEEGHGNAPSPRMSLMRKFMKDTVLKILGKEDYDEHIPMPKNRIDVRMLHVNKVVTKK